MNFKKLQSALQEKKLRDAVIAKDYPTIDDLIREQNIASNEANTVHYRRDLDSLG